MPALATHTEDGRIMLKISLNQNSNSDSNSDLNSNSNIPPTSPDLSDISLSDIENAVITTEKLSNRISKIKTNKSFIISMKLPKDKLMKSLTPINLPPIFQPQELQSHITPSNKPPQLQPHLLPTLQSLLPPTFQPRPDTNSSVETQLQSHIQPQPQPQPEAQPQPQSQHQPEAAQAQDQPQAQLLPSPTFQPKSQPESQPSDKSQQTNESQPPLPPPVRAPTPPTSQPSFLETTPKGKKKRPKPLYSRLMIRYNVPFINPTNNAEEDNDDEDLIEKYFKLSLKDPLTGSRIQIPIRSRFCSHAECFDYITFLSLYNLRPFRIHLRRQISNLPPGPLGVSSDNIKPVVLSVLNDTKRPFLEAKKHNFNTSSFEYKNKMKNFKYYHKPLNDLEWFCCPICNLEFNIKKLGDIYVVGELIDLLLDVNDLSFNILQIDLSNGETKWINDDEEEAKPIKETEIQTIDLDDEDEDYDDNIINTNNNTNANTNINMTIPKSIIIPTDSSTPTTGVDEEAQMLEEIDALFDELPPSPDSQSPIRQNQIPTTLPISKHIQPYPPNVPVFMPISNYSGVVAFRPTPFTPDTQQQNHVFMSGEGVPDDPIVLD